MVRISDGKGFCSGFQVAPGLLMTAAHCVDGARLILIDAATASGVGVVAGLDTASDLALVRYSGDLGLRALEICLNDSATQTELTSYGFPGWFGLQLTAETSHLRGYAEATAHSPRHLVATDLAYSGMSGGPIMDNRRGCVAGITSQMAISPDTNKRISLGIPAETIRVFLARK